MQLSKPQLQLLKSRKEYPRKKMHGQRGASACKHIIPRLRCRLPCIPPLFFPPLGVREHARREFCQKTSKDMRYALEVEVEKRIDSIISLTAKPRNTRAAAATGFQRRLLLLRHIHEQICGRRRTIKTSHTCGENLAPLQQLFRKARFTVVVAQFTFPESLEPLRLRGQKCYRYFTTTISFY